MLTPLFPSVTKNDFINSGGMASVYADPRNSDYYLKKFNVPLSGEDAQMLIRLIDVQRWARPSEREILLGRFSWPVEGFGTPEQILGYSMPKAPLDAYFNLTTAGRTKQQLLQLKYLMDNKYWSGKAVGSSKPNIDEQDRLEMAIDLIDAIQVIHRHGLVYGDVSSNNMCGRLGGQPSVFLLDADSIVTPDIRARNPVRTPGWVIPDGLDPTAADRSLISLFIWRFMLEDPNVIPNISNIDHFHLLNAKLFAQTLVDSYQNGFESDFAELSRSLRLVRDDARDARAITRAMQSKFARYVLMESAEAKSAAELTIIANAESQIAFERLVEVTTGTRQRILMSRSAHRPGDFKLDLSPSITASTPPTSIDELREMVLDARETEIAVHLSTSGLGNLETNSWLPRSMEHALIEAGPATISSSVGIEHATIYWTWPIASFVNHAELKITLKSGKTLTERISRDSKNPRSERSLQLKGGGAVRIDLKMAIQSPTKNVFLGPDSLRRSLIVLAPLVTFQNRSADNRVTDEDDAVIIDIQEQERLRGIAQKSAQRVRRNRFLGVAASILGILALGAGYLSMNATPTADRCNHISIIDIGNCRYMYTSKISTTDFYRFSGFEKYLLYHSGTNEIVEG